MLLTAVDQRRVQQIALTENDTAVTVRQNIPLLFGNIRRSQKDGFTWERMVKLVNDWLPPPRGRT